MSSICRNLWLSPVKSEWQSKITPRQAIPAAALLPQKIDVKPHFTGATVLQAIILSLALTLTSSVSRAAIEIATAPGTSASVADETSVVIWNPQTHTEVLTERITLTGSGAASAVFIVPTPYAPVVAPHPSDLGIILDRAFHPRRETGIRRGIRPFWAIASLWTSPLPPAGHNPSVGASVHTSDPIGDGLVVTSSSTSGLPVGGAPVGLPQWLRARGVSDSPLTEASVTDYLARGWSLAAIASPVRVPATMALPPLRPLDHRTAEFALAFSAEQPVLPGEAEDMSGHRRVYIVSDSRADLAVLPAVNPAADPLSPVITPPGPTIDTVRWAAPLSPMIGSAVSRSLGRQFAAPPAPLPPVCWVTVADDNREPPNSDDLVTSAAVLVPVSPVEYRVNDVRVPVPVDLVVAAIFCSAAGAIAWRRKRTVRDTGAALPAQGSLSWFAPWNIPQADPQASVAENERVLDDARRPPRTAGAGAAVRPSATVAERKVPEPRTHFGSLTGTEDEDGPIETEGTAWIDIPGVTFAAPTPFTIRDNSNPPQHTSAPTARSHFKRRRRGGSKSPADNDHV